MKVKDLIEKLEKYKDMEIILYYNPCSFIDDDEDFLIIKENKKNRIAIIDNDFSEYVIDEFSEIL